MMERFVERPFGFHNGKSFFAGANSANGFVSFYPAVETGCDRVYNVVGGAGTGKSSLMKKVVSDLEKTGVECEKYFCSSDPESLDAVRLRSLRNGRTLMICDATAPHAREFKTPGAVTHLIDLSVFWDDDILEKRKNEITELENEKAKRYKNAYEFLAVTGKALEKRVSLGKAFDEAHINEKVNSLLKKNRGACGTRIERPVSCFSMLGEKYLDNEGFEAEKRLRVDNFLGFSHQFISLLAKECEKRKLAAFLAPNPILPTVYDEIFVPEAKLFVTSFKADGARKISYKKYLPSNYPFDEFEARAVENLITKSKECALRELEKAKRCHFELERIYGSAMDFEAKDKFDQEIVKNVSSYLA